MGSDFLLLAENAPHPHISAKFALELSGRVAAFAGYRATREAGDHQRTACARVERERERLADIAENASVPAQRLAGREQLEALAPRLDASAQALAAAVIAEDRAAAHLASFDYLADVHAWLGEDRLRVLHARGKPRTRAKTPDLSKVADHRRAVAETRAHIEEKKAERERVILAPLPAKTLLSAALADLDQRAAKGAPNYDPRRRDRSPVDLGRSLDHFAGDFTAWLHRDAIADRLRQMIGTRDAPGALSDDQRENQLAKLEADLLAVERYEEALICAAEATGLRIARRRNADPRAICEVE